MGTARGRVMPAEVGLVASIYGRGPASFKAGRKSRYDEDNKFGLPTGSSLIEDIFKVAPRGFITDVEFDCGGLKFFSREQTKR
jgi:hypothetical protein